MKKFIYFLLVSIFFPGNLYPQWSTDPNNNLIVGYGLDPHICSDSAGGCYITYNYENIYYPRKLALERLDKYGYKPWGTLKQILGESPQQYRAKIIEDGEGGAIISYIDRYENLPVWTQRVRVQRVDSSGNFLWGQTGVRVTLDTINQGDHHLATDGNGGCVIVWQDVNYTYFINRIARDGNRLWGNNGITLNTGASNSQPIVIKAADGNYYVQAGTNIFRINQNGEIINQYSSTTLGQPVPDPEGGIVLSGIVGNVYNRKLVAQRKDSLGNNLWQEPYVEISDSLYINTQLRVQNNTNYFYFGWSGRKEGIDQIAQFQAVRSNGSLLFGQGSMALFNRPSSLNVIFPSELANTIFIYWNHPNLPDSTFAQMYDTLGNKLWNKNGVLVAHPAISSQSFTTDGEGGFIIGGSINEFTVVVQQVSKNGYLGEIITDVGNKSEEISISVPYLYQNYPNPFNSSTIIKYQIQNDGNVKISLYNILGERIKVISDEYKSIGTHLIIFKSDDFPSGVYIYTLETSNKVFSKKLTIIK